MGIDVYLEWPGQTKAEKEAQWTGFSIEAGNVGYLRESYHGGPYVTQFLLREAFDEDSEDDPAIPAAVMRERLPAAVMLAIYRDHVVYGEGNGVGTIELAEDQDISPSLSAAIIGCMNEAKSLKHQDLTEIRFNDEQVRATNELITKRSLPDYVMAFVDFVELAERKEKEIGQPCTVHASW